MLFLTNLSRFAKVKAICETVTRGVFKRIDENRELLELLQQQAPGFLDRHPWVEGWLEGQDEFLSRLATAVGTENRTAVHGSVYPRRWPGSRSIDSQASFSFGDARQIRDCTQPNGRSNVVDLKHFSEGVHRRANVAMFDFILNAFQGAASANGYSFSRDESQAVDIDIETKHILGGIVVREKLRFVAPLYDSHKRVKEAAEDLEDVAWVDAIIEALGHEGVFVVHSTDFADREHISELASDIITG